MNPLRGETPLAAGDKTYTLVMDINALCEAEDALGMNIDGILGQYSAAVSTRLVRGLVWAGLQRKHPEIDTLEKAGEIINDAGFLRAKSALELALKNAMPEPSTDENPPKRGRAGTGSKA